MRIQHARRRAALAVTMVAAAGSVLGVWAGPSAATTQTTLYSSSQVAVRGIVFDSSGDLFFADTGNGRIEELAWNGSAYSATPTLVAGGLANVNGLAFDASGDLFAILDNGAPSGALDELQRNGSSWSVTRIASGFDAPVGVAVNPFNHDLYVASESSSEVDVVAWNAGTSSYSSSFTVFATGISGAAGIWVEPSTGNLFVSAYNGGVIDEFPWSSGSSSYGAQVTLLSGLGGQNPNYLATDAAHNLFFDMTVNGTLDELAWTGSSYAGNGQQTVVESGLSSPVGMGIDAVDNLYTGTGSSLVELSTPLTPQTISFSTSPPAETYGSTTDYAVGAAGGASGNPVTFSIDASSTSGCTLSGTTVHFVHAGSCVIDANQAGNATFAPAAQVQQTVTVDKATQSVAFTSTAPATPLAGGSYQPVATGGASGQPVTFAIDASSTPGACSYDSSTQTVQFDGAGTCVIDADQQGDTDYLAAPQLQQVLSVVVPALTTTSTSTTTTPTTTTPTTTTPTTTAITTPPASSTSTTVAPAPSGTLGPPPALAELAPAGAGERFDPRRPSAVPVSLRCRVAACSGLVEVSVARHAARGRGFVHLVLASGHVHLAAGSVAVLELALSSSGRQVLPVEVPLWYARYGRYRMTLTIVVGQRSHPGTPVFVRAPAGLGG